VEAHPLGRVAAEKDEASETFLGDVGHPSPPTDISLLETALASLAATE